MSNSYEPPSKTTERNPEPGPPSPFFGLPVAVACVALGLLLTTILASAVISGASAPRHVIILLVSVGLSFLCLGIGSLIRNHRLFHAGFVFMLVGIVTVVRAFFDH